MRTIILGIIIVISSATIAILALSIGGFPKLLNVLLYLRFPPARFYVNAMRAIEKLEALSDRPLIPGNKLLKQGIIGKDDIGFKELVEILRENRMFSGEVDGIILGEIPITGGMYQGNIPLTPEKMRFLGVIQYGDQTMVHQEQFDLTRITRDLKDMAEEITRKRVANYILVVIALYLIVSIYLVITV